MAVNSNGFVPEERVAERNPRYKIVYSQFTDKSGILTRGTDFSYPYAVVDTKEWTLVNFYTNYDAALLAVAQHKRKDGLTG